MKENFRITVKSEVETVYYVEAQSLNHAKSLISLNCTSSFRKTDKISEKVKDLIQSDNSVYFKNKQIVEAMAINQIQQYFYVSGYFKDSKEIFENFIVTDFDSHNPFDPYEEDDIFLYGITEEDIISSLEDENGIWDFVITTYKKIEL